jgi:hypothetical protein
MKLVKEHINEKFEEQSDPIKDLGIGIEHEIKEKLDYLRNQNFTFNISVYPNKRHNYWLKIIHPYHKAAFIRRIIQPILKDYIQERKRATSPRIGAEWFKILPKYKHIFKKIIPL